MRIDIVLLRYLLLVVLLWATAEASDVAQGDYLQGKGTFRSQEGDSSKLINTQLKYSAFKDVITKAMKGSGFKSDVFWLKYEEKFEAYFKPTEDKLKERFAAKKNPTKEQQEEFEKLVRLRRLVARVKFGRLARVIKSYSETARNRSEDNPDIRYLYVNASVDGKSLSRLYLRITGKSDRGFGKIYITSDFRLEDCEWFDLGVESEADFSEVVQKHWKDWLEKNLPHLKGERKVAGNNLKRTLQEYLRAPVDVDNALSKADLERGSKGFHTIRGDFASDLWLSVEIIIKKVAEDILLGTRTFQIDGGFTLTDLSSRRMASYGDFSRKEGSYSTSDPVKLGSALAQSVWSLPLKSFKAITDKANAMPANLRRVNLTVYQVANVRDLISFMSLLTKRGLSRQFRATLSSYTGSMGTILLEYSSTPKEAIAVLRSLNNTKVKGGRIIFSASQELPFSFSFKEVEYKGEGAKI